MVFLIYHGNFTIFSDRFDTIALAFDNKYGSQSMVYNFSLESKSHPSALLRRETIALTPGFLRILCNFEGDVTNAGLRADDERAPKADFIGGLPIDNILAQ